jgi:hypothetical protein
MKFKHGVLEETSSLGMHQIQKDPSNIHNSNIQYDSPSFDLYEELDKFKDRIQKSSYKSEYEA